MKDLPDKITPAKLDCIIMPNGEVMCLGKIIGNFEELKEYLTEKQEIKDLLNL